MEIENYKVRNFVRNLTSKAVNKILTGNQRNSTSRDSLLITDNTTTYQSTRYDVLGDKPIAGISSAGE